ncbi:DUF6021 family protein [Pseudomonas sp. R5(2019)]|uniref:DUF6021 family protein n=1 Tax=Pseudomonas sp. R5(2019) TaxID=2697566 RepID=UPI001411B5F1|nr:DUF6021 family protein [Pseudomonas sp. R5(2019)]NBA96604.1 hypothetical protein [Pseudomonas sp. R5(2019)]
MSANTPTGPHSSEHGSGDKDLGFDPDSPDVGDPQVDPIGPARAPLDPDVEKDKKPTKPYDPLGDLKY